MCRNKERRVCQSAREPSLKPYVYSRGVERANQRFFISIYGKQL